jgi:hypothetical protein
LAHPRFPSLQRIGLYSLILLAFSLPFELERAWVSAGPLVLTNVELLQGVVLALAGALWLRDSAARQTLQQLPRSWLILLLLFLAALFLSAALAPAYRANALKAALRTAGGMALGLAVLSLVQSRREASWLAAALTAGGLVAAAVGLAEVLAAREILWLALFRPAPTVAGPFLRLSGPFDYANQAAMYIEATIPFLAVLGWRLWRAGRRGPALLMVVALLVYGQAAVLTFSRASFAAIALASALVALLLWAPRLAARRRLALPPASTGPFLGLAAGIIVLVLVNAAVNPAFRLRFSSEGDNEWYEATIDAPAALEVRPGERRTLQLRLKNDGSFTWRSEGSAPVKLAARWLQPQSGRELQGQPRWLLPQPLAPGEQLVMRVVLQAPRQPGEYQLRWDLVQENVVWFSAKTGYHASTAVTVRGEPLPQLAPGTPPDTFTALWRFESPIPDRRTLWRIAWELWQSQPLRGIGLDNFRLRYGEVLGSENWNESIHTNNWYIETVVSAGLLGALPFVFWLALLAWDIARRLIRHHKATWLAATGAGILAFLIHGLLDYFLIFNATGLLFWLLVGLWLQLASGEETLPASAAANQR